MKTNFEGSGIKRYGAAAAIFLTGVGLPAVCAAQTTAQAGASAPIVSGIETVVVTVEKTAQSLQKTPAAVTAISSADIVAHGITNLTGAQNYIPSTRLQTQGSSVEIYIRGIGSTNDYANTEPPVSFNINGIYMPREAGSTPLFDLARIDILPGPQGTLYGRSAIGGVVDVIFQRPTSDLETKALAEIGNYGLFHATLVQNIPVSDKLALRAGVDYMRHDGYFTSGAGSADDISGRLSLLYTPNDNFTAYVWAFATHKGGYSGSFVNKGFNPATGKVDGQSFLHDNPWNDTLTGPLSAFAVFGPVRAFPRHYHNAAIGGQFDWQIGNVTITDMPAYIELGMKQHYFLGALPGTYNADISAVSNELRVSSSTDSFKWQVGLDLYRQANTDQSGILPLFMNYNDGNVSKGLGLYAQATYSITKELRLTLGGRYSSDSRTGHGRTTQIPTVLAAVPWTADVSSNHLDWKVGVAYDLTKAVMLYATAQTGYQPATYNATPSTPTFDNRIEAPTITAFDGGFKSRYLDDTLQVNSEFFYYIYKHLPLQGTDEHLLFNPIFNAQRVNIYGDQTDIVYQPTRNDHLTLSVGYLHSRQTEAIAPVNPLFGSFSGVNVSGLQLQNAPTWTITAGYSHDFQLSSGYIRAAVNTHYESEFYGIFTHAIGSRQKPYTMTDASFTYYDDQGGWSFGAWVKNIEDEPVQAAIGLGGVPGPALAYLEPPRTFGVRMTYDN